MMDELKKSVNGLLNNIFDRAMDTERKKDFIKAKDVFIESVEKSNLNASDKVALISNAGRMVKKQRNRDDIFEIAECNFNSDAKIENIDLGWFMDFLDKADNVCDDEMKMLFGKLLADVCNDPKNRSSKSLLSKLYMLNPEEAKTFKALSKYLVNIRINEVYYNDVPFIIKDIEPWSSDTSIEDNSLLELENIGLIKYDHVMGNPINLRQHIADTPIEIHYKNEVMTIKAPIEYAHAPFTAGLLVFTRDGVRLMDMIEKENSNNFLGELKKYFSDSYYEILSYEKQ